jgi:hypothetical protein
MEKYNEEKIKKLVDKNLIGYVVITHMDANDLINTFHLPGILLESSLVIVPYVAFLDEVINHPSVIIRFYLVFSEYRKKHFVDAIDRDTFYSSDLYANMKFSFNRQWNLFVLSNNVGDFLQLANITYYSGEILKNDKIQKLVFAKTISHDENRTVDLSYWMVNEYFLSDEKIYVNLDLNEVSNGILITDTKKIVGIIFENKNRIITVSELEKILLESEDKELLHKFKTSFENKLYPESKLIEVDQVHTPDLKNLLSCVLVSKRDFLMYGANNTLTSFTNYFQKHYGCWERAKTLIAGGPELIKNICRKYKINFLSLNVYLIIQMIVLENKMYYNMDHPIRKNLDLSNLKLEAKHFTSVIYSYFYDNLEYLDMTNVKINNDITKTLSNYLYLNSSLQSLILKNTGLDYNQLFIILTSIRQGYNKNFSLLNISNNKFRKSIAEQEEFTLENPGIFKFCVEMCKITSLRSLIISNVYPQEDVLTIFRIMHEFFDNSNMILNLDLINLKNEFTKINLSNVEFSKNSSKFFPYDYFTPISDFFSISNKMEEIYLSNCGLIDEDIELIMPALSQVKNQSPNLKVLDLSRNKITTKGAVFIKKFLSTLNTENITLDELMQKNIKRSLNDVEIKNIKYKYTSIKRKLIQEQKASFTLYLNDIPSLEPGGVSLICEGICEKSVPINLHLDGVKIKNEGMFALYNALKSGHPIIYLSLAKNDLVDLHIHSIFFRIFFELESKCYLTCLNINSNKLTTDTILNLLNQINLYSQHLKIKPCKIICDPINLNYLKQFMKNKESVILDNDDSNKNADFKLIKNVQFCNKKKKKKIEKNKFNR